MNKMNKGNIPYMSDVSKRSGQESFDNRERKESLLERLTEDLCSRYTNSITDLDYTYRNMSIKNPTDCCYNKIKV